MGRRLYTVDNMIEAVRSLLDEDNNDTLTDEEILASLNRGQDHAVDVIAIHYPDPYITFTELSISPNNSVDIPEDCYSDRVTKVEYRNNEIWEEVQRISYRDITPYDSPTSQGIPYYYYIVGNSINFVPNRTSGQVRLWYVRTPDELVKSAGRITKVLAASQKLIVDSPSEDLSEDITSLESFFNVVDGQSGRVKASFQIKNITNNIIEIKQVPTATSVLNRTIATDIAAVVDSQGNPAIQPNDYIAKIQGTCVPYFSRPSSNYVIQFALAELKRKMGEGAAEMEERIKKDFEDQLTKTWSAREQSLRVRKTNRIWSGSRINQTPRTKR